jgi:flavodoxin
LLSSSKIDRKENRDGEIRKGRGAMKKVIVAYVIRTGKTERMAEYIAEGVRLCGNAAEVKKVSEIKNEKQLDGYDGYIFGCPTYHRDMTENMKTFLFLA